jgi:MFS family permease
MPLILKYGRRPLYIVSFMGYTATAIWCGVAKTYGSELAGRILLGFFSGSAECVAPLTIADIFFLHERGFWMS